jgi:hypothetical protein
VGGPPLLVQVAVSAEEELLSKGLQGSSYVTGRKPLQSEGEKAAYEDGMSEDERDDDR